MSHGYSRHHTGITNRGNTVNSGLAMKGNRRINKPRLGLGAVLMGGIALLSVNASASVVSVPWVGSADYSTIIGAAGELVGPFDSYDFSNGGVVLIEPAAVTGAGYQVGDIYNGYYQSYVTQHTLSGAPAANPQLNNSYELTFAAQFTQQVTGVDAYGNATFAVTGGSAGLFLDSNVDTQHSFTTDSGFNDGTSILSGTISGGGGSFISSAGFGVTGIDLTIGAFDYNTAVYNPATIAGANGIFTLNINPYGVSSGVSSVLGNTVDSTDLLLEADGNLNLQAVPLPPALWLFGSAVLGLMGFSRRITTNLPPSIKRSLITA